VLSQVLTFRPIQWIRVRSYAIYLLHYPIGLTVSQHMSGKVMTLTCFALTLLAAELSFRLVEKPAQRFARNLAPAVAATSSC
jgi:peptidoglycan/LPS O-acetylase OafA/YrhL